MLSLFLSRRFFKNQSNKVDGSVRKASPPALFIATTGIAVGLAVMIISICFVKGFQREVSNKFTGVGSYLQVLDINSFGSPDTNPIVTDDFMLQKVKSAPGVTHVQRVSRKMGIFKTDTDFAGIVLKGVGSDFDYRFMKQYLVSGKMPSFSEKSSSNQVVISQTLANQLKLKVGDKVYSYFFSNTIKQRRFEVVGIYNTYMKQFDKTMVLTDLSTVNQLNRWKSTQSTAVEVQLTSFNVMPKTMAYLKKTVEGRKDAYGHVPAVVTANENPQTASVLSWLNLLDLNVMVILVITAIVAGFAMISGLLILILERTSTIGLLKALGATNSRIRHTFLLYAAFIVGKGMLWGNILGLGLVLLQQHFHLVTLDPETYYVATAPVEINVVWIVLLNMVTLLINMLALVLPSFLVSRVQPAKAIQFD